MTLQIKIVKNLVPRITNEMRSRVAVALNRAALTNESEAKQLAPVDTGALRNSIQATKTATKDDLKAETSVGVDYGIYVELGNVRAPAQPFMTPAFEIAQVEAKKQLSEVLKV